MFVQEANRTSHHVVHVLTNSWRAQKDGSIIDRSVYSRKVVSSLLLEKMLTYFLRLTVSEQAMSALEEEGMKTTGGAAKMDGVN